MLALVAYCVHFVFVKENYNPVVNYAKKKSVMMQEGTLQLLFS